MKNYILCLVGTFLIGLIVGWYFQDAETEEVRDYALSTISYADSIQRTYKVLDDSIKKMLRDYEYAVHRAQVDEDMLYEAVKENYHLKTLIRGKLTYYRSTPEYMYYKTDDGYIFTINKNVKRVEDGYEEQIGIVDPEAFFELSMYQEKIK